MVVSLELRHFCSFWHPIFANHNLNTMFDHLTSTFFFSTPNLCCTHVLRPKINNNIKCITVVTTKKIYVLCTFQGYTVWHVNTQNVKGKHCLRCKQIEVEAPFHGNNNNNNNNRLQSNISTASKNVLHFTCIHFYWTYHKKGGRATFFFVIWHCKYVCTLYCVCIHLLLLHVCQFAFHINVSF